MPRKSLFERMSELAATNRSVQADNLFYGRRRSRGSKVAHAIDKRTGTALCGCIATRDAPWRQDLAVVDVDCEGCQRYLRALKVIE